MPHRLSPLAVPIGLALFTGAASGQVDARMLRQPDVSATDIAFVYAGDIWVVPKQGGTAQRLSTPSGEESFPRFSPDGAHIAFSGNYDGNTDIYVVPTRGGEVVRVTHHPWTDVMVDWYPDGETLLYNSAMESGVTRLRQFYRTTPVGGMPAKLPFPHGEFAAVSADGRMLAYTPQTQAFSTWKRYRGGDAPDVWVFDLEAVTARNITASAAMEEHPMWHGRILYFSSDRGPEQRHNIWAYHLDGDSLRQVTQFRDFDIRFPAIGPSDLVFALGPRIYLLDLATEQTRPVDVRVVTDLATVRLRTERVGDRISGAWLSPTGRRALVEARGDVFTVPAEHGPIRNLTRSAGTAERYPTWSPDGQTVAYMSDASGEYQLTLRPADGRGSEERLTSLPGGYRYRPFWAPDSRKLAFRDERNVLRVYDRDARSVTVVEEGGWRSHFAVEGSAVSWSRDSRWMAYEAVLPNQNGAIVLYDVRDGARHQVTSGFHDDYQPVFDPAGNYLYFYSNRTLDLTGSDIDASKWAYLNATNVVAATLRPDVPSPLAFRNDGEPDTTSGDAAGDDRADDRDSAAVEIAVEGFERRLVVLPPNAGNFGALAAAEGKVVYLRGPRSGGGEDEGTLMYYDLAEREEQTVLENVDEFWMSADGKKALVRRGRRYAIVDVRSGRRFEDRLRTADLEMTVDPRAEWRQLFTDAWRFQRDFFYDPNMHGVDWNAVRSRYGALLPQVVTRWDLHFVLGEMIGELNASHTYRFGGDTESAARRSVGMLGVDWELDGGAYRIARIVLGAPWDAQRRSPLAEPGVDVREGDYVLAVNGMPLDVTKDPWASFQGMAGATVTLTVNNRPTTEGARDVLVELLANEGALRYQAWVEANRLYVERATDGRIGYVHVPNTAAAGHEMLMWMMGGQLDKHGLIVDERFNSGGFLPDGMVEVLARVPLNFQARHYGADGAWPRFAVNGPKVMLINGWSGSGGDAFPEYFRKIGVGPIIGTRTWGGRIGLTGSPSLIDGGEAYAPTYRNYDPGGGWFAEGHGVEPDIVVPQDPAQLARGVDVQLDRAIREVLGMLEEQPPPEPRRPPAENRTANGGARR